jgi:hypothetical protein
MLYKVSDLLYSIKKLEWNSTEPKLYKSDIIILDKRSIDDLSAWFYENYNQDKIDLSRIDIKSLYNHVRGYKRRDVVNIEEEFKIFARRRSLEGINTLLVYKHSLPEVTNTHYSTLFESFKRSVLIPRLCAYKHDMCFVLY